MIKAAYFGLMPPKVRYSAHLKPVEKLLYCELTAQTGTGLYCIADTAYLAGVLSCTEGTLMTYLASLEKTGDIVSEKIGNGRLKIEVRL